MNKESVFGLYKIFKRNAGVIRGLIMRANDLSLESTREETEAILKFLRNQETEMEEKAHKMLNLLQEK